MSEQKKRTKQERVKLYVKAAEDILAGHSQQKVSKRWDINVTIMSFLARGLLPYVSRTTNRKLQAVHAARGRKPYTRKAKATAPSE